MDRYQRCREILEKQPRTLAVIGFDAFIDRIGRGFSGLGSGQIDTMTEMGRLLAERGEHSGTVRIGDFVERMGGNTPNTARVLSSLGAQVLCIGAFGRGEIEKPFQPLKEKCRLLSYGEPGSCLALEFQQSKLFFGHNGDMDLIGWPELRDRIGLRTLVEAYEGAGLVGLFNWAEIACTQRIWDGLLEEVLPVLTPRERTFFFDFSDLTSCPKQKLAYLPETLKRFRPHGRLIVSANALEAERLGNAALIREGIADSLIMHTKTHVVLYGPSGETTLQTRFCEQPKLLTGGGDCFNAGFCYGLMCGLDEQSCLEIGCAAAGCIVRTGEVPGMEDILEEIERSKEIWSKG